MASQRAGSVSTADRPQTRRPRAATSSTSSAAPTSRSPPRSTGSSPTRSSPAACSPARACRRCASSAPRCASTPTPCARSTAGWPTPGYVVGRHGAGTRVVDRPPVRRGSDALAGIVAETLRRAAQLGLHARRGRPGHVHRRDRAQAPRAARAGAVRRVHERRRARSTPSGSSRRSPTGSRRWACCSTSSPTGSTATTTTSSPPRRSTPTRRRPTSAAPVPVVAMLVGSRLHVARPRGRGRCRRARRWAWCAGRSAASRTSPRCSSSRGATGVEIVSAVAHTEAELDLVDRDADIVLLSREAMALGLDSRFERPGAPARVELRVRPRGPRAPAPRDRAGRRLPRGRPGLTTAASAASPRVHRPASPEVRHSPDASPAHLANRAPAVRARGGRRARPATLAGAATRGLAADIVAARARRRGRQRDAPRRRAERPGRRAGRARAAPRDLPPAGREGRRARAATRRWTASTEAVEAVVGEPVLDDLLDAVGDEFPDVDDRPAPGPARGAAADPGREREPGGAAAARPRRRHAAPAGAARRDDRPRSRRTRAALTPIGPNGETLVELLRAPARAHPTSLAGQLRYVRDQLARPARRRPRRAARPAAAHARRHRRGGARAPPAVRRRRRRRRRGGRGEAPDLSGPRRRAGAVLERLRVDAAARADRQEHPRLARPAVAALRPRHPDARRDPRRGARPARALGHHRPVADRAVGAQPGVAADQGLARQPGRGRVGLLAGRLPDRRRPGRRGGLGEPAAAGLGSAASGSPRTWCPTTWASTRAGSSSTRSGSSRCPSRPTPATRSAARTSPSDERVEIRLEDHYWDNSDAAVVFERRDRQIGRAALRLPRQRRHELPVERHRPARLHARPRSASR